MAFRILGSLLLLTVLGTANGRAVATEKQPLLAVKFAMEGVEFSGTVDTEETGQELAESVRSVRPDLGIINRGLSVDPGVELPPLADIRSLLAEIGISTHEGGIAIWDDALLVTGMTDSVITLTALKIRMEPLLEGRRLINRICIVNTDDLPDITVKLADGKDAGPLIDFEKYPTASESFEMPGLAMAKLYPTLLLMSDLRRVAEPGTGQGAGEIRAVPLMTSLPGAAAPGGETPGGETPGTAGAELSPAALLRAMPAEPVNAVVSLEPIRFSSSSFLLQTNQRPHVNKLVKQLQEAPLAGHPIRLRALKPSGGSAAFYGYLCDRRSAEARRLLVEGGIPASRLTVEIVDSNSPIDGGEVLVSVEIPPEPEEPEGEAPAEDGGGGENPGAPKTADASPAAGPEREKPGP